MVEHFVVVEEPDARKRALSIELRGQHLTIVRSQCAAAGCEVCVTCHLATITKQGLEIAAWKRIATRAQANRYKSARRAC
jgi:hypothetical protein